MNRRRVMMFAVAVVVSRSVQGQQSGKLWTIGFLAITPRPPEQAAAFRKALADLGYVEGRNLVIEWRNGDVKKQPALALELVQLKVDVICASSSAAISAAQNATSAIPIIMSNTADPVTAGFVKSLAHPGGNITGLSSMVSELGAKHVEELAALVPKLARIGVLFSLESPTVRTFVEQATATAQRRGAVTIVRGASTPQEIDDAFAAFDREKVQALVVHAAPFFADRRERLVQLVAQRRIPAIYGEQAYVVAGGLMSYGQNVTDMYVRLAGYVDRILRGARPEDLPVEQPKSFELVINERAAKAQGLRIPRETLLRADIVIK